MQSRKGKKFSPGFGILEVLISGTIIIIILGALVTIARSALTNAKYMQERAQAISLAAEAIETVRQIRDSNYIDQNSASKWNTVIGNASILSPQYGVVYYIPIDLVSNRLRLVEVPAGDIDIDGTNFARKITFVDIGSGQLLTSPPLSSGAVPADNGFIVKVAITWAGIGGKDGKVELQELIANSRFVY